MIFSKPTQPHSSSGGASNSCRQEFLKHNHSSYAKDIIDDQVSLAPWQEKCVPESDTTPNVLKFMEKALMSIIEQSINENSEREVPEVIKATLTQNAAKVKQVLKDGADVNATTTKGHTALMIASQEGYTNIIATLMEHDAHIDAKDEKGKTALMYAKSIDVVNLLIKGGGNVNLCDNEGFTPLMSAAESGNLKIVEVLCDAHADIHKKCQNGMTALSFAFVHDHLEIEEYLQSHGAKDTYNMGGRSLLIVCLKGLIDKVIKMIESGSNVNSTDKDGNSPLMGAAQNGNLEVVKLLLDHGATVNAENQRLMTPLLFASYGENREILQELCKRGAKVNHKNIDGDSPLMICSLKGQFGMVKDLIGFGADVNIMDQNQRTPLMTAAQSNNVDILECLYENGSELDSCLVNGATALFIAVANNHFSAVEWLVQKKANINAEDENGSTVLFIASLKGHRKLVTYFCGLRNPHMEVNKQDKKGRTALMAAAQSGNVSVVRILMKHGADVTISDTNEVTALEFAAMKNHGSVIKYILSVSLCTGIDNGKAFRWCALHGDINSVEKLLRVGIKVDSESEEKRTALILACQQGFINIVKMLVQNKADINKSTVYGTTALTHAIASRRYEVVTYLLENGAKTDTMDINGETPLLLSIRKNDITCVFELLLNKANPNEVYENGRTALMEASELGVEDIVEVLLFKQANPAEKDRDGADAVSLSYIRGHQAVREKLKVYGCDISKELEDQTTEKLITYCQVKEGLIQSIIHQDFHISKQLVKDFPVDYINEDRVTALIVACRTGNLNLISELITCGAEIDLSDKNGMTALTQAVICQNVEVAKHLITHGANVNCTDEDGDTPLSICALADFQEMAKLLIENGGNVNHLGQKKATPLMAAAQEGNFEMIKLLIQNGAKVDIRNSAGIIAADYANIKGNKAVEQWLKDYKNYMDVKHLISEGMIEEAIKHSQNMQDINFGSDIGLTLMHEATKCRNLDLLKNLIDQGGDVDAMYPETPLITGMESGNVGAVEVLVGNGCIMDFSDTSCQELLERKKIKSTQMKDLLEKFGRDETNCNTGSPEMLSTDEDRRNMKKHFRQFVKEIRREKTPKYIQHCTRSKKFKQIIVNIDEGSLSDAKLFARKMCSDEIFDMLKFIQQSHRPFAIMIAGEDVEQFSDQSDKYLEPGCKLSGVDKSKIGDLLTSNPPMRNVADACRKITAGTSYGSLGCFAQDESNILYGITSKHIFDEKKLNEVSQPRKEIFENEDIHSISEILVPQNSQPIEQIEHFSDYIHAIFEKVDVDGDLKLIDVAVLRLTLRAQNSPHLKLHFTSKDDKPVFVEPCDMDDDDIIDKIVQKSGATTGFTKGKIIDSDYEFNVGDDLFGGLFVVIPTGSTEDQPEENASAAADLAEDQLQQNMFAAADLAEDQPQQNTFAAADSTEDQLQQNMFVAADLAEDQPQRNTFATAESAEDQPQQNTFATFGDSGALVVDQLNENEKNQAYGLCYYSHPKFMDEEGKQHPEALLCVRLNHCFTAIETNFQKNMKLCNPPHPEKLPQSDLSQTQSLDQPDSSDSQHRTLNDDQNIDAKTEESRQKDQDMTDKKLLPILGDSERSYNDIFIPEVPSTKMPTMTEIGIL